MPERLSTLDASFLYLEDETTPMHVGSVLVLDPPAGGFDYDKLVDLVGNRIAYVPRYRQRVQEMPLGVLNPLWVDDAHFDLTYHVRRAALPKPGTTAQLEEFVGRVQARSLDRSRPLWEVYLVEGLEHGRFAIVTKSHEALVDGINAMDLGQVILDAEPSSDEPIPHTWRPGRSPSIVDLIGGAALDIAKIPQRAVSDLPGTVAEVRAAVGRVAGVAGGLAESVVRILARPAPDSPLNTHVGAYRRYVMVESDLADYKRIRTALAGTSDVEHVTLNDVLLAAITGALRAWLLARGQAVDSGVRVRAMVPLSIYETGPGRERADGVEACFVDLPVGEPRPAMRLHQIAYSMQQQVSSRAAVDARSIAGLAGFAPSTIHSLGARLGSVVSRRIFNLVVTNVPGPQQVLYAADAPMVATYPVIPLARGQALTIGVTSYNGKVYFGLVADRDSMPDVDLLGQCIAEAIDELKSEVKGRR